MVEPRNLMFIEHREIIKIIKERSKVLDLGCGDGSLISELTKQKNAKCLGVEIDAEAVYSCVEKGLTVFHSDIENALPAYSDNSFDFVIINGSFQQMKRTDKIIEECFRIAKIVIAGFPNFAYISARKDLLFGKSPVTKNLPYEWYNSPNLRFLSIKDFEFFCFKNSYKILCKSFFTLDKKIKFMPNLFAKTAVFVISK